MNAFWTLPSFTFISKPDHRDQLAPIHGEPVEGLQRWTSHLPESELFHVAISSSPCRGGYLSPLVSQINLLPAPPPQPPRAGKLVVPLAFGSRLAEMSPDLIYLVQPSPSTLDKAHLWAQPLTARMHVGCVYTRASAPPWLPQDSNCACGDETECPLSFSCILAPVVCTFHGEKLGRLR